MSHFYAFVRFLCRFVRSKILVPGPTSWKIGRSEISHFVWRKINFWCLIFQDAPATAPYGPFLCLWSLCWRIVCYQEFCPLYGSCPLYGACVSSVGIYGAHSLSKVWVIRTVPWAQNKERIRTACPFRAGTKSDDLLT